jgi:hypothetical protein
MCASLVGISSASKEENIKNVDLSKTNFEAAIGLIGQNSTFSNLYSYQSNVESNKTILM